MAKCSHCHKSFREMEDEQGMHDCPHCGFGERPEDHWHGQEPAQDPEVDFRFYCHGSIWLCEPVSVEARAHFKRLAQSSGARFQWLARSLVVELRYVDSFAAQLENEGFSTEV